MKSLVVSLFRVYRPFTAFLAALLLVELGGCAGWKVRDEGFPPNELSETVRQARPAKHDVQCSGLTEKGREIERNLNAL